MFSPSKRQKSTSNKTYICQSKFNSISRIANKRPLTWHAYTEGHESATPITQPERWQAFLHHQHQSLGFNDGLCEASRVLSLKEPPPHKEDLSLQHPKQKHVQSK